MSEEALATTTAAATEAVVPAAVTPVVPAATEATLATTAAATGETKLEFGKWVDQASTELRALPILAGKPKIDDLIKDYQDKHTKLESLKGVVPKPGEKATPEQIQAYREYRGVPKEAKDYNLVTSEDFSKLPAAQEMVASYQEAFHEAGLAPEEASKAWAKVESRVVAAVKSQGEAAERARTNSDADLQKAWGDKYKPNMQILVEHGKKFYGDETWAKIEKSGLGNDRAFLESQLPVAMAFRDGKIIRSGGTGQAGEKNPAKAMFPNFK